VLTGFAILATILVCSNFPSARADKSVTKPLLRRPVALALANDGKWLFVANRDSGTISVIDTAALRVTAEPTVGRRLSDMAIAPDSSKLLATDEDANELIVLARNGSSLKITQRVKVSPNPVTVRVAPDGSHCTVAGRWSWRIDVVSLRDESRTVRAVNLPFAPREQLPTTDGKHLIVADGFGGRLAVVDTTRGTVDSVRTLPAHNIRGLALSGDGKRLLIAHQMLHPLGSASRDDIHWGNLLTNNLRSLPLSDVLNPSTDVLRGSDLNYFGEAGHGTGDPAGLSIATDGRVLTTLAGVAELAISTKQGLRYVPVGSRPTAVVSSPDGRRAYVACTFGDSASVVDLEKAVIEKEIALGESHELSAAERGEVLFHNARLSHDGWMSCQSCHTDGHTNGQLADTLGDGTYGTPKRVLTLLGVGDTGPWAWNGSMAALDAQVRKSVETTLHGGKPSDEQVRDLTAYLKSLPPAPSRSRLLKKTDEDRVSRGRELFAKNSCTSCHAPPTYTTTKNYDVGLTDERGVKHFNPPSLRGVGQGGPYFHDGRAATLDAVFAKHRHQLKNDLGHAELDDLLEFLQSL
jgi:YVTN family beta-propeller protein